MNPLSLKEARKYSLHSQPGEVQPEGSECVEEYTKYSMDDPTEMLYLIAWLLHEVNQLRSKLEGE